MHPLHLFTHCPRCGAQPFAARNEKAKQCEACGFTYYFNPSAAVACFIHNPAGELLTVKRAKDPARGTLDLPGGFVDMHETAEEAVCREVREETGLQLDSCRYLFSLPNVYPYGGFEVHTLDMFFAAGITDFADLQAADDAEEILFLPPARLRAEDFGLSSIRQGLNLYKKKRIAELFL